MKPFKQFQISLQLPGRTHVEVFDVVHNDETFTVSLPERAVHLLNNGDNSWNQVKGDLPQEWINALGDAIEKQIRQMR